MNNALVWLLQFILPRRFWYRRFYLRSKHWRAFRWVYGTKQGWRCKVAGCSEGGYHLDVHHRTYERLFREQFSDVELLCRRHHRMQHERK
jgi:hypothetical protein